MKGLYVYLNFDGQTKEAMTFYANCLGATLNVQTFGDVGMADPPAAADRVIHARVEKGPVVIMASDSQLGHPVTHGDNFWLNIDCESAAEQDQLFASLGEGGKVMMPLQDQFWGARFGMLKDKYGVGWMFNFEHPKS